MNPEIIDRIINLRREINRHPELSNQEKETAGRILRFLKENACPDYFLEKIGGEGLLVRYDIDKIHLPYFKDSLLTEIIRICCSEREEEISDILFRCELDAIDVNGPAHLCGHDGHMAIMCSLACRIDQIRKQYTISEEAGKIHIWIIFQPAEETGEGAVRVVEEMLSRKLCFDYAFALHNAPGKPLGEIQIHEGTYAYASTGMEIILKGHTSHAATPELANNPTGAILKFADSVLNKEHFITIVNIDIGSKTYGITPGEGAIRLTLRASDDSKLEMIKNELKDEITELTQAGRQKLNLEINYIDYFPATINNEQANKIIREAAENCNLAIYDEETSQYASDDFACFSKVAKYHTFFDIGSGIYHPPLHDPRYFFPEELIFGGNI